MSFIAQLATLSIQMALKNDLTIFFISFIGHTLYYVIQYIEYIVSSLISEFRELNICARPATRKRATAWGDRENETEWIMNDDELRIVVARGTINRTAPGQAATRSIERTETAKAHSHQLSF